jgi:TetR/AcrR family transcriptional repressor of nem operon
MLLCDVVKQGAETRAHILNAAEALIFAHGYAGTSVDAILERTGLTKGAFFHHFPAKQDLARALIERYARQDWEHFEATLARAERLSRDPVQQVLILVGLYEETLAAQTQPHRGCLFASYCYQAGLFDEQIHAVIRESMLQWRDVLGRKLQEALEQHPPRRPVDPADLADAFITVAEGAYILSKALNEPEAVAKQLRQFRNYLELLFGVA